MKPFPYIVGLVDLVHSKCWWFIAITKNLKFYFHKVSINFSRNIPSMKVQKYKPIRKHHGSECDSEKKFFCYCYCFSSLLWFLKKAQQIGQSSGGSPWSFCRIKKKLLAKDRKIRRINPKSCCLRTFQIRTFWPSFLQNHTILC